MTGNRLIALPLVLALASAVIGSTSPNDSSIRDRVSAKISHVLENIWGEGNVRWLTTERMSFSAIDDETTIQVSFADRPRASTIATVDFLHGERLLKRYLLGIRVLPFAWVPVVNSDLDRHKVLTASNITWERREVTEMRGRWLSKEELTSGSTWWTKVRLRSGEVVDTDHVEERPEVVLGDRVNLIAESGSVTVKTEGIALSTGRVGERVLVERSDTGSRLKGIIREPLTVEVEGVAR